MRHSLFFNKVKKETLAQVFFCELCEISKNTFFTEHLWATASDCYFLRFIRNLQFYFYEWQFQTLRKVWLVLFTVVILKIIHYKLLVVKKQSLVCNFKTHCAKNKLFHWGLSAVKVSKSAGRCWLDHIYRRNT